MSISRRKSKKKFPVQKMIPPISIEKQMLSDLEKRINLNLGNYLVLTEEGDPTQIALAQQKAKSEFHKFGPEMHRIAQKVGGRIPDVVSTYLESVDSVLHCSCGWIDDEVISQCFHCAEDLESELNRE